MEKRHEPDGSGSRSSTGEKGARGFKAERIFPTWKRAEVGGEGNPLHREGISGRKNEISHQLKQGGNHEKKGG